MRPHWWMLVAGALLLGSAGCVEPLDDVDGKQPVSRSQQYLSPDERAEGLAAQRRLLADRVVSRQDYETSVRGLQLCLSAHGITLINEGWNPIDQLSMMLWYRATDKPDEYVAGYGDSCHQAYLSSIEEEYRKNTRPVMSPHLMALARKCLVEKGIQTRGTEKNMADLLALSVDRTHVTKCVEDGVNQLGPGVPIPLRW